MGGFFLVCWIREKNSEEIEGNTLGQMLENGLNANDKSWIQCD
jgi:hypothetical protein